MKKETRISLILSAAIMGAALPLAFLIPVQAETPTNTLSTGQSALNVNTAPTDANGFVLKVCDGPDLSQLAPGHQVYVDINGQGVNVPTGQNPSGYIPCDFNGAMLQIQRLINAMIILGVFVALIGFCFAGYLYVTGTPGNISRAHGIFKKVAIGFILMLSAWFVVYQILAWLTGSSSAATTLLGTPTGS